MENNLISFLTWWAGGLFTALIINIPFLAMSHIKAVAGASADIVG